MTREAQGADEAQSADKVPSANASRTGAGAAPSGAPARVIAAAWRGLRRLVRWGLVAAALVALVTCGAIDWGLHITSVERPEVSGVVNDVTQINPVRVASVIAPTTTAEIVEAIRTHDGPIAIGGGRYSMGGQTAAEQALQIDLRSFNRILAFDSVARTIRVQSGARWRQIQERIDPAGLSVKIMQTYANFTVGGSLSVNVHGRYVGLGPVVLSVREFQIVLPDGREVRAAPSENREIFYGAIGGYGGLGVITEVTLELAENVRVKRTDRRMPLTEYAAWFRAQVRDSARVVFHNADLYPDEYDRVNAVTYTRTDEPVTVPDRLIARDLSYRTNRAGYWAISELWGGREIREHLLDPWLFRGEPVTWRNYEASYDVAELEPASRAEETYVLQEYFVPVAKLEPFVQSMGGILRRREVNAVNVSIRHAMPDPGTLLAWAPEEVFALVLYYKQDTDEEARERVGMWTRELVDAVLAVGGRYYLPYQVHATDAQFLAAYPRATEFFALKRRLDPTNKFRNTLWDRYYTPRVDPAAALTNAGRARLDSLPRYRRPEGQTFLTHPEWYIVYSSEEYAAWMKDRTPTGFPYVASIGQYWRHYAEMRRATRDRRTNTEYQVMLGVIGVSYSAEFALKGVYEATVGRFSGWTAGGTRTTEDSLAYEVAEDYARFLHDYPWYLYDFRTPLAALWRDVPLLGRGWFRKLERRAFLTAEFGIKWGYGALIGWSGASSSGPQAETVGIVVSGSATEVRAAAAHPSVVAHTPLGGTHTLLEVARYQKFNDWLTARAASTGVGLRILEIAGNDDIVVTGTAPRGWRSGVLAEHLYSITLPVEMRRERFTLKVRVAQLLPLLRDLGAQPAVRIEHVYDY